MALIISDAQGGLWELTVVNGITQVTPAPPGSSPTPVGSVGAVSGNRIVTNALIEAGWLAQGETPNAPDANFALGKLNRILDQWSAKKIFAFAEQFAVYNLVPNLAPHTIGPTGAFVVPVRPVRILGAALRLNNVASAVDCPIAIRDADWWNNQRVKSLETAIPTDLYYEPDMPNGSLYFWPVPNVAYQVLLRTWQIVSTFATLATSYNLPPGYEEAITMTLAASLIGPNSQALLLQAREAITAIQGNNSKSPRISTTDAGMPTKRRVIFNYFTGQ